MNRQPLLFLLQVLLLGVVATTAGCQGGLIPAATPVEVPTIIPIPPTDTAEPFPTLQMKPTPTIHDTPTALPGRETIPISRLAQGIPWLPASAVSTPGTSYFAFNTTRLPFGNALVRQAFMLALDRQALLKISETWEDVNPQIATTFTPPEVLGRDLVDVVGLEYDPQRAQQLLTSAGYPDGKGLPVLIVFTRTATTRGEGVYRLMAQKAAEMWQKNLGVTVQVQTYDWGGMLQRLDNLDTWNIYHNIWLPNANDPDEFLRGALHSGSASNRGRFTSLEFDRLVNLAASVTDPLERQEYYIQAEKILCENMAGVIPIYHGTYKR